jgi:hypothetical protein
MPLPSRAATRSRHQTNASLASEAERCALPSEFTSLATVIQWFLDEGCSPSLKDVEPLVEQVNVAEFDRRQDYKDGEAFVELAGRALTKVQRYSAKLAECLLVVIATDEILTRAAPVMDPVVDNAIRRTVMERGISASPLRPVLERALEATKDLQREVGPPKSRGRPPADWLLRARILAPRIADVLERSGIHSSHETADGPLIKVLAKAMKAATGQTVENDALSSALGRHPPFKGL